MGIISTGFKVSRTIKNIGRLREIVSIFARHGFDEFIPHGVISKIPGFVLPRATKLKIKEELDKIEESGWSEIIGLRLRLCFEELGPAFVKFGQLFASREDLFDEGFINQMKLLRDQVSPLPFSAVRAQVEHSLGRKIEAVFESVDDSPLGTASIGLVYKAKLLSGKDVVLKVRRPGIEDIIDTDLSILLFMATTAEKVGSEVKFLGLSRVIEDFALSLQNEFNFNIEAMNCEKLQKIISEYDENGIFYVPKIFGEFTTENLLVMELINGIPFSDSFRIHSKLAELEDKLNESIKVFIQTFLGEGFFHADLHGGNFFYTNDGKIALIDFGLVGNLSRQGRQNFVAIIYSILNNNYETLVNEFLDVAQYEKIPDVDKLVIDMRYALAPFIGLTIKQTNFSAVFKIITKTLREHEIFLPREWFIVFRALITLDGVGKSLGMDFDLFSFLQDDIDSIIKKNFQKEYFMEDAFWLGKDILNSSRVVPRHLRWFLKEWSKNGYAFEVKHQGMEKSFDKVSSALIFLGFCLFSCILFMSGLQLVNIDTLQSLDIRSIPSVSYILWFASLGMFFYGYSKAR